MLFIFLALLYLALFVSVVPPLSTSTTKVCATYYGKRSTMPVPSRTRTKKSTVTINRAVIVVPITTRTPKLVTRTSTSDVTIPSTYTALQETDVVTTTTRLLETSTTISIITTLSTTTETTTATIEFLGVTTTVSTAAGFLPIKSDTANPPARKRAALPPPDRISSIQAQGLGDEYDGNDWCGEYSGRNGGHDDRSGGHNENDRYWGHDNHDPWDRKQYPTSVMCEKFIKTLTTKLTTSTMRKTTITRVAKTPTSLTITSTHTSTITEFPAHATTTKTVSTTTTTVLSLVLYEESTTTATATSTSTLNPTQTAYPGCGADNFISSRNGHPIIDAQYVDGKYGGDFDNIYNVPSAQECCQICQRRNNCGLFYWYAAGSICFPFNIFQCAATVVALKYNAPDRSSNVQYTVGNGNCGRLQWDGQT